MVVYLEKKEMSKVSLIILSIDIFVVLLKTFLKCHFVANVQLDGVMGETPWRMGETGI